MTELDQQALADAVAAADALVRPEIVGFDASEDDVHTFTFVGRVVDPSPGGLVVHFGGLPSLKGRTATTAADGTFALTVLLAHGETGTATAVVTNAEGVQSAVAQCYVYQTPQLNWQ